MRSGGDPLLQRSFNKIHVSRILPGLCSKGARVPQATNFRPVGWGGGGGGGFEGSVKRL